MSRFKILMLAASALVAISGAAKADYIFDLSRDSTITNNADLNFDGELRFTNNAVNTGRLQIVQNAPSNGPFLSNTDGIESLLFQLFYDQPSRNSLNVTKATFTTPAPAFSSGFFYTYSLAATLNGLFGQARFNNTSTSFDLAFSGLSYTGILATDGDFGCQRAPCSFEGSINVLNLNGNGNGNGNGGGNGNGNGNQPVPVPEPASLALFGIGLLGMGLIRRRKANQAV